MANDNKTWFVFARRLAGSAGKKLQAGVQASLTAGRKLGGGLAAGVDLAGKASLTAGRKLGGGLAAGVELAGKASLTAGRKLGGGLAAGVDVAGKAKDGLVRAITGGEERPKSFADVFYDELQAIAFLRWRRRPASAAKLGEIRRLAHRIDESGRLELSKLTAEVWEEQEREEVKQATEMIELERSGGEMSGRDRQLALAHHLRLRGLALSGGGIRSATFGLGVLRALAKLDLLRRFDYLSTVSGGGYIGSWLAAWVQRQGRRSAESGLRREPPIDGSADHSPVRLLRAYSNFLTPRTGLLSLDTWMAAATYARNLILNLAVLVLALTFALLVPRLAISLVLIVPGAPGPLLPAAMLLLPAAALLVLALVVMTWNLEAQVVDRVSFFARPQTIQASVVIPLFLASGLLAVWLPDVGLPPIDPTAVRAAGWRGRGEWLLAQLAAGELWAWALGGALAYLFCWSVAAVIWAALRRSLKLESCTWDLRRWSVTLASAPLAGAGGGACLWLLTRLFGGHDPGASWSEYASWSGRSWLPSGAATEALASRWIELVIWGPALCAGVILLTGIFHIGLTGRKFPEDNREWWSRLGGWLAMAALVWVGALALAIYAPPLVEWLRLESPRIFGGLSLTWLASTVGGVLAGRSSTTGRDDRRRSVMELVAQVAPYVFVAGLLAGLSYGVYRAYPPLLEAIWPAVAIGLALALWLLSPLLVWLPALEHRLIVILVGALERPFEAGPAPAYPGLGAQINSSLEWTADALAQPESLVGLLVVSAVTLGVSFFLSWRVDINQFAMHLFYRNRLVRAYLGASRQRRRPQPFTGLDSEDDLRLQDMDPRRDHPPVYDGPLPILNTALNLTTGDELAWQDRRATSFAFTPLHYGFLPSAAHGVASPEVARGAYRPTRGANAGEGISLGTATAISGAAVNPNMGFHSTPALAFLLTVFNVRLGWWLGNPAHPTPRIWKKPAPRIGLMALLGELFGRSNARGKYVHLSDGGHFDNLGIYELVRRRCRLIVACDAEGDASLGFGALGNTIRRCRSDFGVDIEIDVDQIRKSRDTGLSSWHCAVGKIHYPDQTGAVGTLIYLKASLTGDESSDLLQYAERHDGFPHESTADQWFDEAQFESYRKLGYHVAMIAFKDAVFVSPDDDREADMERIVQRMRQRWVPPLAAAEGAFTRHTATLAGLFERLRTTPTLRFLDPQIYPEWNALTTGAPSDAAPDWLPYREKQLREGFYFCNQLIQLMENVYVDVHLEEAHDHPDNRGWMNLFKHWSWSGMFQATWAVSACTYGHRFQAFCERRLGLASLFQVEAVPVPLKGRHERKVTGDRFAREVKGLRQLNVLERDIVRHLLDALAERDVKSEKLKLWALEIVVTDPLRPQDPGRRKLRFGCGFALTRDGHLAAYRIQDHLRQMGLGRKGLLVLAERHGLDPWPRWILDEDLPEASRADFSRANFERCAELLTSVALQVAEREQQAERQPPRT